ncbi:MAG: AAA family ATPase, partial [Butyricicoccaceae bacterium]
MLRLLHIENIAIIERVDIEFDAGFTVLTGETGAGKSIIIDAITAIMGHRTSRDLIRGGAQKGCVSAVFDAISPVVTQKLTELGVECEEDGTLHIQREISADGKNVCRINMRPVTATVLKQISPYLINIHGQHDGQKLMQDEFHIDFLDSFCHAEEYLREFQPLYHKLFELRREIRALERSDRERAQRVDMLKFQIEEIGSAELQPDEESVLEEKKAFFDNVEKLSSALIFSSNSLNGQDDFGGVCSELDRISTSLSEISGVSDEFDDLYRRAEELRYLAQDLAQSVASVQDPAQDNAGSCTERCLCGVQNGFFR